MTGIDGRQLRTTAVPGSVTVRDLVELRHLQATLLAGEAGADRRVSWAHVSDAFDPWNWLEPGDLVLTCGYIVPEEPAAQARFVEQLAEAGLSGLVIGEDERRPHLSAEMLAAADRVGFPVIDGAHPVAFAQYVRFVAAANARGEDQSFTQIARVNGEVMASLRETVAGTEFVDRLSRVVHCRLHIVDPDRWEALIRGGDLPGKAWKAAYDAEVGRASGRAPFVMNLVVGDETALTMPIPSERSACLVAFPLADSRPRLAVLQQVAAACALEIGRVDTAVERYRRSGAGLLNDALNARLEPAVLNALFHGRHLEGDLRALAIDGDQAAVDRLARRMLIRGIPFLLGEIGQVAIAVVRAGDLPQADLEERTTLEQWRAGLSDPFAGASNLGDAVRQARWALETVSPDGAALALYGDSSPSFLPRTLAESKMAADRVLGPLIEYDRVQGTELVKTLEAYLECDRSPSRASELLFIHTQTVNYRITRIQELTGRSMRSTGDVSELWFALRALALSQAT
ncbi:PucR family transcriptional regulator [Amycolatopsis jejuensis]|uniref:PucR family transcriptional regulator n=1 Tax=Amycolatopsis jejuensis TaxID=330084 RepID=UPI0005268898|nr:PucR family transcriptional regulator ligand-binding domain-containing protein [Amycolatopsis jejuensis]